MATEWTEARRATLRAFCDTTFPSLQTASDPHGFWQRKASDFGIDVAAAATIDQALAEPARLGLVGLIDAFAAQGIANLPTEVVEQVIQGVAASSPEAAQGVLGLQQLVLGLCYGLPNELGEYDEMPA